MMSRLLDIFQDFQRVLIICPICGEIHRLSELKLFYRGKAKYTWLDALREKEDKIERAEELLEENWDKIKAKAQEKGKKQIPRLLKKCVPIICAHGYYPQDLKPLFDPVDFIIFDGMNLKEKVRKVVLFDGPPHDNRREKIQTSLKKVIKKGNYDWYTVKLDKNGHVIT